MKGGKPVIDVGDLEVNASQPKGGLDVGAAQKSGMYTGDVTNYTTKQSGFGGNLNIGKYQFSLFSRVTAPGMSGYRVIGFKSGKFQAAIDYHNWVLRKSHYTPIQDKFWHYHWGRRKTGGHHRQLGTGLKILDISQLRNGILGRY